MTILKKNRLDLIFKYLNQDEMIIIENICEKEIVEPETKIITLGDRNRDLLFIEEGSAGIFITDQNGKKFKVAEQKKGEFIGEQNFILPVRRSADVIAETKMSIRRYQYAKLVKVCKTNNELGTKIFALLNDSMAEKFARTIDKYINGL